MKRKIEQAHKLAMNALNDKPEWKPSKGYKYLKDLESFPACNFPRAVRRFSPSGFPAFASDCACLTKYNFII